MNVFLKKNKWYKLNNYIAADEFQYMIIEETNFDKNLNFL